MPLGQPSRSLPVSLATQAPVPGLTVGLDGRGPSGGGDFKYVFVDRFGDRHADRAGQPSAALCEPGHEVVGAVGGVRADQGLPPAPVVLGQLGQGESGVVMWSAVVLEPAFPGLRRAATGSPVPPDPWSRKAVRGDGRRSLPGRGSVLLVGVGGHEDTVETDDDLARLRTSEHQHGHRLRPAVQRWLRQWSAPAPQVSPAVVGAAGGVG
jgi:hypothetical protein